MIKAVLFDIGGVLFSSPFDAFARYEREHDLPVDFIRTLNATNPDTNSWARLERNAVSFDEFCTMYEAEATAAGHNIDAREVMACLTGDLLPEMVNAVRRCRDAGYKVAALTNNFVGEDRPDGGRMSPILDLFELVIESSVVGVRKPDPEFYGIACEKLGIEPSEAVFLDDLGINLKPAKAMGMTTIKVVTPDQALADLEAVVGFPLR